MGTMNDSQFIKLLKQFFFEYFILKGNPSLMNLTDVLESYKKQIIEDYNTKKTNENECNNNEKPTF